MLIDAISTENDRDPQQITSRAKTRRGIPFVGDFGTLWNG